MTDEVEAAAVDLMERVQALGGAVAAIEQGFQKGEIERSAYDVAREIDDGERVVVGVNRFTIDDRGARTSRCGSTRRSRQSSAPGCSRLRAERDQAEVDRWLAELRGGGVRRRQRALPDARGTAGPRHRRRGQ